MPRSLALAAGMLLMGTLIIGSGPPAERSSGWRVRTSIGFDALCALNVLSGDPYYLSQYPADTALFAEPRYASARAASRRLKAVIKDEGGGIVSAFLTLILSGGPDSSLETLLASARQPERIERSLRASPFWSERTWAMFQRVRPDLVVAIEGLIEADFESDWQTRVGTRVTARVASLADTLARYDVLAEQERLLGRRPLAEIEVVLLYFSRPHGIRIQGERFLTNVGYPLSVVLRNAAHEPLHPPYDARDPNIAATVRDLGEDPLIKRVVATHDRSFGYNTVEGYVEEDVVQALEQVVSERLRFAESAAQRWQAADGGMHLLAAALYDLMQETGIAESGGRFSQWLVDRHRTGDLRPTQIEQRARAVLGDATVDRWVPRPP